MKHLNNNRGLTLIEMLATITILLIIGGIVYAMLFQMFTNVSHSEQRISARQEANLILAYFTTVHQKNTEFAVERIDEHFFTVTADDGTEMRLGNDNYTYQLEIGSHKLDGENTAPFTIDLTNPQNKEIDVRLTLESNFDSVEVKTTISRMTEAK